FAAHGGDALSFARGGLTTVRDAAAGAPAFLAGVAVAFASTKPDFASVLGSLTGVPLAKGAAAGALLRALFAELASRKLSGDEVKLLVSHLGDDALLKTAVTWLRDNWAKVEAVLKEGADKLREWIDYVLGLAEKVGHPFAFPEHDRLVGMLKWLQG